MFIVVNTFSTTLNTSIKAKIILSSYLTRLQYVRLTIDSSSCKICKWAHTFSILVMDLSKLEPVITIFNGNKVIDNICIIHKFKTWYAHCMLPFSWSWEKNISQQFDLVKCKGIANSRY
jgi:hypothetical protein